MSDITWIDCKVRLGDLKEWPDNPALISEKEAERLMESYDDFNQAHVFLIDPENTLIDGHQRKKVWVRKLGADAVMDCRMSSRMLTDAERRKMAVYLRSGAVGHYDWDKIASWDFQEIKDWGFDDLTLKMWNNDANNLKELLNAEKPPSVDAEPQVDRAEQLQEIWQVKTGDLWQIGEHRLICGDCTDPAVVERVMGGEKADLGFADPPYNAGVDEWDKGFEWQHDWIINLCRYVIVTPGISSAHDFMKATNMPYKWTLAAYLTNGYARSAIGFGWWMYAPLFSNESVFKQKPDMIKIDFKTGEANGEYHRGQKPPQFMDWIVGLYGDEIVFDCFTGSGTTLVACENLSRKCRAVEISPAYCSVTLQRMADAFPHLEIKRID